MNKEFSFVEAFINRSSGHERLAYMTRIHTRNYITVYSAKCDVKERA